ncbi:uncharacterized protein P174DRAFT_429123 [Aspergillus novofumigatus IBT 16806]|uniref:BZIP domain-containing protein n=1 Tax=Aspergillus novofumigatus (strain IBT 16806) TaxID=1392255 RepID=A0A2I1CJC1_ASPN1|nr:uncharacterized protein P174DRAFT_429123 [Aspergillus novofumigatus IBT 16806]PKX97704.1 hypothetical protein P174DRAFT_429123 [Aspergillus novofumigatus IBT 16806]
MQRSRANASSAERTSKRTTKVPVSERAYRYRKEAATLSLQRRLEHLQTQIQNLNRMFQAYNHQIERSGILSFDPAVEQKLQQLRKQFLAISAAANSSNKGSSAIQLDDIASTMTQVRKQRKHSQQLEDDLESATSRPVNGGLHRARPIPSFNSAYRQEDNPQGKTSAQSYSSLPTPTLHIVNRLESVPCAVDDSTFLNILCRSHLVSSSTAPFRETSFERLLHRACLKNGYNLLVDPTSDPDNVSRVFRLPLTLSTTDSIVQQVKGLLEGGLDEALELWGYAFLLARGRGDSLSSKGSRRKTYPSSKCLAEPQSFQSDHDLLADLGLNGEWLDSHDVEGYLKEKGLSLMRILHFAEFPHVVPQQHSGLPT